MTAVELHASRGKAVLFKNNRITRGRESLNQTSIRLRRGVMALQKVLDRDEVAELLQEVLEAEDFKGANLEVSSGSSKGDGYLSFLTKVDVEKDQRKLHLMIKCAPRWKEFRDLAPIRLCFLREIYVYQVVFPEFASLQEALHVPAPFDKHAKCYKCVDEEPKELLVLENLKEQGYSMWNRRVPMDDSHVAMVCLEYGKYHACSYALKQLNPKKFDQLTSKMEDVFSQENVTPEMFQGILAGSEKVASLFVGEDERHIGDALRSFKLVEYFEYLAKNSGKIPVITHGDCWCNNMMFKYEDPTNPRKPTQMRLIDFQLTKLGSPTLDLSYFFYVSTSKKILDNLDRYLRIYFNSLCTNLKAMGCDSEGIVSFTDLKEEWKVFGKFGYVMSLLVLKAMLREEDELVDLTDVIGNGQSLMDAFEAELKSDEIYRRQKDIVVHMYENGMI